MAALQKDRRDVFRSFQLFDDGTGIGGNVQLGSGAPDVHLGAARSDLPDHVGGDAVGVAGIRQVQLLYRDPGFPKAADQVDAAVSAEADGINDDGEMGRFVFFLQIFADIPAGRLPAAVHQMRFFHGDEKDIHIQAVKEFQFPDEFNGPEPGKIFLAAEKKDDDRASFRELIGAESVDDAMFLFDFHGVFS